MKLRTLFKVIERKEEHERVHPGKEGVEVNSEGVEKGGVFHSKKNRNKKKTE